MNLLSVLPLLLLWQAADPQPTKQMSEIDQLRIDKLELREIVLTQELQSIAAKRQELYTSICASAGIPRDDCRFQTTLPNGQRMERWLIMRVKTEPPKPEAKKP